MCLLYYKVTLLFFVKFCTYVCNCYVVNKNIAFEQRIKRKKTRKILKSVSVYLLTYDLIKNVTLT